LDAGRGEAGVLVALVARAEVSKRG